MMIPPKVVSFYFTFPLGLLVGKSTQNIQNSLIWPARPLPPGLHLLPPPYPLRQPLTYAALFAAVFSPLFLQLPSHIPSCYCSTCQALSHFRGFALAVPFAQKVLCMAFPLTPMSNVFFQRPSLTTLCKRVLSYQFFFLALIITLNLILFLPC